VGCLAMIEPAGELSLLDRVETYLRQHGMKPSRFGQLVNGHRNLVTRLRQGRKPHRDHARRIEAQLSSAPRPMTLGQFKAKRYRIAMQENIRAELAERDRRLTDPFEQAAILLRSRGWRVFRTEWADEAGQAVRGWFVGSMRKTDDDMQAMARRNGWRG
jgi:hypothetical protein